MILAGDIGGTKTQLGLYDSSAHSARPTPVFVREFVTTTFPNLVAVIQAFAAEPDARGTNVRAAAFGVAGPVLGTVAELTNLPFQIDAAAVSRTFDIPQVTLVNDLAAMAYAVPLLADDELTVLQEGTAQPGGNIALIAAGTGLGEALLHWVHDQFVPSPTEAGHADWAARNERDITVLRALTERFGRAEVEHLVSGRGLVNLHRITHENGCTAVDDEEDPGAPAAISQAALARRCRGCVEALSIFVDAYGAEAGNLALRSVATGGVFIGGGIAPKILPALTDGRFLRAFLDKGTFRGLLARMPVKIILNQSAGLLGAAVVATSR